MEKYKPPTTKLSFHNHKKMYHVFLSFRGEDVRKTLVDHLYEALTTAGLIVFLDSEKLEKGETIWLSLERAIESSVVRIPIFSSGYADSAWCLREAAAMLRTPGLIIPLFYHVNPTHVRYPDKYSSPYYRSFFKHSARYPREEIDEWKRALQQICSYSGWSMDITQGYEARLIRMVVNDLMKTLERVSLEQKDDGDKNEGEAKTDEKEEDGEKCKGGEDKKDGEKVDGEGEKVAALKEEEKMNGEVDHGEEEKDAALKEEEKMNGGVEINKNERRVPSYVIEYKHTQLFSDENPNACSIM